MVSSTKQRLAADLHSSRFLVRQQSFGIGGIVDEPTGEWVVRRFREMTFEDDPFLKDKTYLIVGRCLPTSWNVC